jgi:hypothetical protein
MCLIKLDGPDIFFNFRALDEEVEIAHARATACGVSRAELMLDELELRNLSQL